MRDIATGILALTMGFSGVIPLHAGVYNTSEGTHGVEGMLGRTPPEFVRSFRPALIELRNIASPKVENDYPLRKRYILQEQLAGRAPPALTTEQKLNLGAVFIRRGKANEAVNLLGPLARQEPKNFLVQSNLATAYQMLGETQRAADTLTDALDAWPKDWQELGEDRKPFFSSIGWTEAESNLYRPREVYQLKLLRLRKKEGPKATVETVDALFADNEGKPVRFVGESGKFEVGTIARAEKAKLPRDAIDNVQQLLLWLPGDLRLYWLLGELYNAEGGNDNIRVAKIIFEELGSGFGGFNFRAPEFDEHRKVLRDHEVTDDKSGQVKLDDPGKPKDDQPRYNMRSLVVGFGTGFVVAIFTMWQIREIRRRRQRT